MNIQWITQQNGSHFSLPTLDLSHSHFTNLSGVYIIWHGSPNPAVVRVGQGNISERLAKHRQDREIIAYQPNGLYVTWAAVPNYCVDGVECYLGQTWNPKVGSKFPDVTPIAVNSPWS